VAELALILMMTGLRQTSGYHIAMTKATEQWLRDFPADIDARERQLAGRSVGIVGFGGIGQHLARLLKPFHVMLRIYDPYLPADSPLRSLPNTYLTPHAAGGIMESLERSLTWLADDLEAHLNGQPRKYAVTEKMLVSFPG
jgi:phosphoglycerate dehydrogenase-like enzyme